MNTVKNFVKMTNVGAFISSTTSFTADYPVVGDVLVSRQTLLDTLIPTALNPIGADPVYATSGYNGPGVWNHDPDAYEAIKAAVIAAFGL